MYFEFLLSDIDMYRKMHYCLLVIFSKYKKEKFLLNRSAIWKCFKTVICYNPAHNSFRGAT